MDAATKALLQKVYETATGDERVVLRRVFPNMTFSEYPPMLGGDFVVRHTSGGSVLRGLVLGSGPAEILNREYGYGLFIIATERGYTTSFRSEKAAAEVGWRKVVA